jgi:hypothetical protein
LQILELRLSKGLALASAWRLSSRFIDRHAFVFRHSASDNPNGLARPYPGKHIFSESNAIPEKQNLFEQIEFSSSGLQFEPRLAFCEFPKPCIGQTELFMPFFTQNSIGILKAILKLDAFLRYLMKYENTNIMGMDGCLCVGSDDDIYGVGGSGVNSR